MQNLLDNYFLKNPLRIVERPRLIVSLATALWNTRHDEPMDQAALHLFLCDETRGDLTGEQKWFVLERKAQVDQMYLRMLGEQRQKSGAMFRPAFPARRRCVRFFRQGKVCTSILNLWPLWAVWCGFQGSLQGQNRAPVEAQRSGFGGKRRRSEMSEFLPFSAKKRDMELAATRSRIKDRRRKRSLPKPLLPAVRAVDGDFRDIKGDVCFSNKNGLWRLCPSTPLFPRA